MHNSDSSKSSREDAIRVQSLFSPLVKSYPPRFLNQVEIVSSSHLMGLKTVSSRALSFCSKLRKGITMMEGCQNISDLHYRELPPLCWLKMI